MGFQNWLISHEVIVINLRIGAIVVQKVQF